LSKNLNCTFIRPWYVLGPGHRWPLLLLPAYWIMERFGPARDLAQRLALLRIGEMIGALVWAIEHPPQGVRILDVIRIRELGVA
jgi:nucleoside-diphosphate-sugar epimerase